MGNEQTIKRTAVYAAVCHALTCTPKRNARIKQQSHFAGFVIIAVPATARLKRKCFHHNRYKTAFAWGLVQQENGSNVLENGPAPAFLIDIAPRAKDKPVQLLNQN